MLFLIKLYNSHFFNMSVSICTLEHILKPILKLTHCAKMYATIAVLPDFVMKFQVINY